MFTIHHIRLSVHTSTEVPFFLYNGRDAREPDDVQPPVRNRVISDFQGMFADNWYYARTLALGNLQHEQERQKSYYDKGKTVRNFQIKAQCLLRDIAAVPGKI